MIEFKNVYKKYDNGAEALKNVNLRIERGEFVFIVGASGSGKSTFLKTIMREEVPTSGTIMINNYDLTKMTAKEIPYFRRTMGIVFQDFRLIPNMTVYDNVAFAMRVIGANEKDIRKRVPYVLSLVGLQNKARSMPNEISGGEQQRVALARALVNNANTIIADEPTGNIDPQMSYEIVDLLNRINENGTTIIMVTHEHDLVKKFNRRIVVIDKGEVVSDTAAGSVLTYKTETGYQPVKTNPVPAKATQTVPAGKFIYTQNPAQSAAAQPQASAQPQVQPQTQPQVQAQPQMPAQAQPQVQTQVQTQPQLDGSATGVVADAGTAPSAPVQNAQTAASGVQSVAGVTTGTISQVFNVPVARVDGDANAAGSPLSQATEPDNTPKAVNFTTIDGVDYSKYFEDLDERMDG